MHLVLTAYANVGDTVGAEKVFVRMLAMGLDATSDTINIILKSIVNSVGDLDWEAINFCYSEYFGFQKFVADTETYTQLLKACESYNRPEQAVIWFNELLSVGVQITPEMRDCLSNCLGEERYREYIDKLHPDYQQVMSEVDIKVEKYLPRRIPPTPEYTQPSRPDNEIASYNETASYNAPSTSQNMDTRDEPSRNRRGAKGIIMRDPNQTASYDTPSRSRNVDPRDELPRQRSEAKSIVMRDPKIIILNDIAEKGDVAGVQAMIKKHQAAGSIPTSVLLEHLVYAHVKADDTRSAQDVVNSMKLLNIEVSSKTYQRLIRSYTNDGDGAGAERVTSESVMSGHPIGT